MLVAMPTAMPVAPLTSRFGMPRRQDDRLGLRAVVVRPEGDGRLLDLAEHFVADAREAALGVTHGGGAVAVERSEVAGPVDERVAQRKRLRHAHERFVEGRVAVRMVAAHDVADDFRALAMLGVGGQVLLPHRVEDAALHRLEPVAHVGQRARRDDRERVVEIAGLRGFVQRDIRRPAGPFPPTPRRAERMAASRPLEASAGSRLSNSDCSRGLRLAMSDFDQRTATVKLDNWRIRDLENSPTHELANSPRLH